MLEGVNTLELEITEKHCVGHLSVSFKRPLAKRKKDQRFTQLNHDKESNCFALLNIGEIPHSHLEVIPWL